MRTLMKKINSLHSLIFILVLLATPALAQPGGGRTTEAKPPGKTGTTNTTPARKPTTPRVTTGNKPSQGQSSSINGKWWTSGNDFGASEVIFTQNGSEV